MNPSVTLVGMNAHSLACGAAGAGYVVTAIDAFGRLDLPAAARRDGVLPRTTDWTAKCRRDVPHPGEPLRAGRPICRVVATGSDEEQCQARLLAQAVELQE
jgi:predicted ATP-grasp superfamily ATP-dependent carboligase